MSYLAQLIYRSKATPLFRRGDLPGFISAISLANQRKGLTGILVFDGVYFLQVIEGRLSSLANLLKRLKNDPRHDSVVVLSLDAIKKRSFQDWGVKMIPLRTQGERAIDWAETFQEAQTPSLPDNFPLHGDARMRSILDGFVQGSWREDRSQTPRLPNCNRITPPCRSQSVPHNALGIGFAFQPIIDTRTGTVRAVEALLRGMDGQSPAEVLGSYRGINLYQFDLESKAVAIEEFATLGMSCDLALNVLPMTLAHMENATGFLLEAMHRNGLPPEQLILEVTEEEAITNLQVFSTQMQNLRAAGIRVAIDDFGAGYAGLSLLSEFQPDQLKIDRLLVRSVHEHGPRQAIIRAVADFCRALGIEVIAEGVEQPQEHHWLQTVGVNCFQGYLFSRPHFQGIGEIRWYEGESEMQPALSAA